MRAHLSVSCPAFQLYPTKPDSAAQASSMHTAMVNTLRGCLCCGQPFREPDRDSGFSTSPARDCVELILFRPPLLELTLGIFIGSTTAPEPMLSKVLLYELLSIAFDPNQQGRLPVLLSFVDSWQLLILFLPFSEWLFNHQLCLYGPSICLQGSNACQQFFCNRL